MPISAQYYFGSRLSLGPKWLDTFFSGYGDAVLPALVVPLLRVARATGDAANRPHSLHMTHLRDAASSGLPELCGLQDERPRAPWKSWYLRYSSSVR